jgi:hypothetical protein
MRFGQKRSLKVRDFALSMKADASADDGTFEGYGSVFGVVDSYKEIVAPGAFRRAWPSSTPSSAGAGALAASQRSADRRLSGDHRRRPPGCSSRASC